MIHGRDAYKKSKAAAETAAQRREDAARQIIESSIEPKINDAIELGKYEIETTVETALVHSIRKLLNEEGFRVVDKHPGLHGIGGYQPLSSLSSITVSWSHYNGNG